MQKTHSFRREKSQISWPDINLQPINLYNINQINGYLRMKKIKSNYDFLIEKIKDNK